MRTCVSFTLLARVLEAQCVCVCVCVCAFVLRLHFKTGRPDDPYCQGQRYLGSANLNLLTPNICWGHTAGPGMAHHQLDASVHGPANYWQETRVCASVCVCVYPSKSAWLELSETLRFILDLDLPWANTPWSFWLHNITYWSVRDLTVCLIHTWCFFVDSFLSLALYK